MKGPPLRPSLLAASLALAALGSLAGPSGDARAQEPAAGEGEVPEELRAELERARAARPAPAPDGGVGTYFVGGVIAVLVLAFAWRSLSERSRTGAVSRIRTLSELRPLAPLHLTTLSIGIDWRARPRVQGTLLRQLGKPAGPASEDHLAHLAAAVKELREVDALWLAVGKKTEGPVNAIELAHEFPARVKRLHELHGYEALEVAGRDARTAGPLSGDERRLGVAIVSLLVVSTEAPGGEATDVESTRAALDALLAEPEKVVAWELGWGPREVGERLSMQQLEARYPDLVKLADPPAELPPESVELVARWS